MAPPALLPHPFIHLMLELLPLSTSLSAPLCFCWSFSSPICYWHVFYPPCSYCSELPSPHSCSCFHLPSCWILSETPYCSCLQSSSASLQLPASALHSSVATLPLLVVFYNLSRLFDDHWWSCVWQSCKLLLNNLFL